MSLSFDRFIFLFFLSILIWAPLPLASNRLWSSSLLCALVFILSVLTFLQLLQDTKLNPIFRKCWLPIALLFTSVFWITIQAIPTTGLSSSPFDSFHNCLLSWALLLFFIISLQLLNSHKRLLLTGYALVGSAFFQAVYGSLMTLTGYEFTFLIPKESYEGVSTGTFINRNSQAGYLVMCVSIGIGLMISSLNNDSSASWRERGRRVLTAVLSKKIILRVSLLIIVAGLVMTHSRMGNTSFFASLMILGLIALVIHGKKSKGLFILLSSLLVLDIFVVGTFFGVDKVAQRLQSTNIEQESRDEVAMSTIELIQANPFTGQGAGSFYSTFPEYRTESVGRRFYVNTHNDYLEFLSEFGVIGTLPLALLMLSSLSIAIYALFKRQDKTQKGIAFGSAMAILAMLIHATVDFNLQMPANAMTFMVILAFAWIALFKKSSRRRSKF